MAFTQKQLFPISFNKGLDTKTDPKQVLAGNLLTLQNGVFNNIGQINKRSGYNILPSNISGVSSYINSAQAINSYNDEMLLFDGLTVYSYISETQTWANKGIAASVITENKQIIRTNTAQQLNPDMAFLNNTEVYVWEDSRGTYGSVRYSVLDTATQMLIFADQPVANNGYGYSKPKAISFNGEFFLFYTDGYKLIYQTISPSSPTLISNQVTIATDGYQLTNSLFSYDISVIGNNMYIAYLGNDGYSTPKINLFHFDAAFTKSAITTVASGNQAIANDGYSSVVNVVGDSFNIAWVTWSNGMQLYTSAYTYPGTYILGPLAVGGIATYNTITAIEDSLPGTLQIIAEVAGNQTWNTTITSFLVNQASVVTSIGVLRSVGLASKAYKINMQIFVNATYQTLLNSTYFKVLITDVPFTVIGKVNSGTGGGLRTNQMLSEIPTIETNVVKFANLTKGTVISEAGTVFTLLGVNATTLDSNNANQFQAVTQNNNLNIVGGILQVYDGVSVIESNFHYPPENVTASAAGSGSGLGTGTYQYQVTYEWADNFGQIEVSTPSTPIEVTVTSGQKVTLTIPTLRLTKKSAAQGRTEVTVCVYRTPVNGTGATLNEVTSILAPLLNSTTVDTVQFVDVLSDIDASSNRFIYTTGGVLDNVAPPASSLITLYQNRIVLSGLEDPNILWFSQNKQDYSNYNTTPTNFAAELTIGCDPLGGPITAIKNLNQNLVIFKATNIFIVQGDGPNNTGGGDSYPNPQILTSADVGCSNQNSIAIIPASGSGTGEIGGLIFQSNKGMYLLDQGLNTTFIGAPVYAYNNLTITSSTLVPDQNQVIFTTLEGTSLVYDYYVNQWSTFSNQYAIDSIIFENVFTYVTAKGLVYQNDETIFTDGGAPILMSWTSPNLSFAQLNGFQRVFHVMLLGAYKGPHTLTVNVAYDFSPNYTQSVTINPTPIISNGVWGSDTVWGNEFPWGGSAFTPYEFRIDFAQQICTAIRIQVTDNQSSNYNEGYAISAMTFLVGVLPGIYNIPATQTYGTK